MTDIITHSLAPNTFETNEFVEGLTSTRERAAFDHRERSEQL